MHSDIQHRDNNKPFLEMALYDELHEGLSLNFTAWGLGEGGGGKWD